MVFTYPMENFVVRHCIRDVSLVCLPKTGFFSEEYHHSLSLTIWTLSLIIGLSFDNLGFVFELIGAVGGVSLGFIFPALCYFRVRRISKSQNKISHQWSYAGSLHTFMLCFGVVVMFIGAYQAIEKHG